MGCRSESFFVEPMRWHGDRSKSRWDATTRDHDYYDRRRTLLRRQGTAHVTTTCVKDVTTGRCSCEALRCWTGVATGHGGAATSYGLVATHSIGGHRQGNMFQPVRDGAASGYYGAANDNGHGAHTHTHCKPSGETWMPRALLWKHKNRNIITRSLQKEVEIISSW